MTQISEKFLDVNSVATHPSSMDVQEFQFHAKVCKSKRQYHNRITAKHSATQVKSAGGPWLRPYQCDVCGEWHLKSIAKHKARVKRLNNQQDHR